MDEEMSRPTVWKSHVIDARGRKIKQLDPVSMYFLRQHDLIDRDALQKIAEEIGPGRSTTATRSFWILEGLTILFMTMVIVRSIVRKTSLDPVAFALMIATIIAVAMGLQIFFSDARRNRHHRVKRVMLDNRRCPHCGYDLQNLPVDDIDRATVCPECGCAWNLNADHSEEPANSSENC